MTAQWDDDIHHAIHTAVSGERQGYYGDFGSMADPGAARCKHGYFHAGTYSSFRHRRHGRPLDTATIPATRLLAYTLTHDQVGNRAIGDRPSQNLTTASWRSRRPSRSGRPTRQCFSWVRSGARRARSSSSALTPSPSWPGPPPRAARREFAEHGWDADDIPDPQDPETFLRSKLNWDEIDDGDHGRLLRVLPRAHRAAAQRTRHGRPLAGPPEGRLRRGPALDRHAARLTGDRVQPRTMNR